MTGVQIVRHAKEQITELTGHTVDTVSGFHHDGEQWHVQLDVIEMKRIPDSSDVLAVYALVLDNQGDLLSYKRTRRYYRGNVEDKQ